MNFWVEGWGVKEDVSIPPFPTTLDEMKTRIRATIEPITQDMLVKVRGDCEYRIDIRCASTGVCY